jgi:ATP-dependent Lon protease
MILNKEQVEEFSKEQCEKELKRFERTYPLNRELKKLTPELFDQVDTIADTLLWLEDRIKSLDLGEKLSKANDARWGRVAELPQAE